MSIVDNLKAEIEKLQNKIVAIQAECSHPKSARKVEHKHIAGYDFEESWNEHRCLLCDKFWKE